MASSAARETQLPSQAPALCLRYAVACRFDIESVLVCCVRSTVARPLISSRYRSPQSIRVELLVILRWCGFSSPGKRRTGLERECVHLSAAPVVATNLREGVLGSVTQWRILPAPAGVFIGLFATVISSLPVITCLSQRLRHACLSSHCSTVKLRMAH